MANWWQGGAGTTGSVRVQGSIDPVAQSAQITQAMYGALGPQFYVLVKIEAASDEVSSVTVFWMKGLLGTSEKIATQIEGWLRDADLLIPVGSGTVL